MLRFVEEVGLRRWWSGSWSCYTILVGDEYEHEDIIKWVVENILGL
jgi:hypothetical protein